MEAHWEIGIRILNYKTVIGIILERVLILMNRLQIIHYIKLILWITVESQLNPKMPN